jgi:hypothetical protein
MSPAAVALRFAPPALAPIAPRGAKSFDKVIEIQTEFAKTAYETFVTELQKITALCGDLAKHPTSHSVVLLQR